jgi:putative oxidoreductase
MNALLGSIDRLIDQYGLVVGRILIGLLFAVTGVQALFGFSGLSSMIAMIGFPVAGFFAGIILILKLGGGLALISGRYVRLGALALIFFVLLTIVFVHQINDLGGTLKNLALIGGLILVYRAAPRESVPIIG